MTDAHTRVAVIYEEKWSRIGVGLTRDDAQGSPLDQNFLVRLGKHFTETVQFPVPEGTGNTPYQCFVECVAVESPEPETVEELVRSGGYFAVHFRNENGEAVLTSTAKEAVKLKTQLSTEKKRNEVSGKVIASLQEDVDRLSRAVVAVETQRIAQQTQFALATLDVSRIRGDTMQSFASILDTLDHHTSDFLKHKHEVEETKKRLLAGCDLESKFQTAYTQALADLERAEGSTRAIGLDNPMFLDAKDGDASAPATSAPATSAPATSAPATSAPATSAPATSAPATSAPATSAPATSAPATSRTPAIAPATAVAAAASLAAARATPARAASACAARAPACTPPPAPRAATTTEGAPGPAVSALRSDAPGDASPAARSGPSHREVTFNLSADAPPFNPTSGPPGGAPRRRSQRRRRGRRGRAHRAHAKARAKNTEIVRTPFRRLMRNETSHVTVLKRGDVVDHFPPLPSRASGEENRPVATKAARGNTTRSDGPDVGTRRKETISNGREAAKGGKPDCGGGHTRTGFQMKSIGKKTKQTEASIKDVNTLTDNIKNVGRGSPMMENYRPKGSPVCSGLSRCACLRARASSGLRGRTSSAPPQLLTGRAVLAAF